MRRITVVLAAAAYLLAGCSPGGTPPAFTVSGASVDPAYWCPGGAKNAHYDLHATVDVHNGTAGSVAIQSITAQMKLVATQGAWLEKVGDVYDAGSATFSPGSVAAGIGAKINVTIASACTSDRYESGGSSRGDYSVTMRLVTSAGTFGVTAHNQHEIRGA